MKIIFTKGLLAGNVVDLEGGIIRIGRGEENELCLMTGGVSRYHGRLECCPDGSWKLTDLGSTNGIKVNGVKIDGETVVTPDDDIEIGEQTMRFEPDAADMDAAVPGLVSINPALIPPADDAAPAETVIPEPAAPPQVETEPKKTISASDLKELIGGGGSSLFSGRSDNSGDTGEGAGDGRTKKGSRRFSNLLFYTVLGALVVMGLSYCVRKFSPAREKAPEAAVRQSAEVPFFFSYERVVVRKDNVFRFSVLVDNGVAVVTVDDLKHRRAIRKEIREPKGINLLRSNFKSSGLMQLTPPAVSPAAVPEEDAPAVRRRLVFQEGFQFSEYNYSGEFVPMEMERAEAAINDFAEIYGLHTVSLTPEELMAQAEASLQKADDLFNNREAGLVNLREAIVRYAYAVSCLEQFSPRPRRWDYARKRLDEAVKIRKEKYKELIFEYNRLLKLREFDRLRGVLKQIMEITDPDSPQYGQARERLFKIDSNSSGKGR